MMRGRKSIVKIIRIIELKSKGYKKKLCANNR